jgi:ribosome biogenesis protein ERB1
MSYWIAVAILMLRMYLFAFSDLLQNPLIVPLKRLSNHESYNDFGIFDVIFHPTQPWVFSSGADKTVRLYT